MSEDHQALKRQKGDPVIVTQSASTLASFQGFVVERVLVSNPESKFTAILGRFEGKAGKAVVVLNRRPFDVTNIQGLLSEEMKLVSDFQNDIYSKYAGAPPAEHALVSVDVVYPATDKHIQKYVESPRHMVVETPEMYKEVVQPYIASIPPKRLQWVYNILEKKAEVERLVAEDPDPETGFILQIDSKWDRTAVDQLYCVALCKRRDVRSLRDLTAAHLPMLRNMRSKCLQALRERYGVRPEDLRMYAHYAPSYYHFHIHFAHVRWPGYASFTLGKAHALDDIIDNLSSISSEYYQRRSLVVLMAEHEDLWRRMFVHTLAGTIFGSLTGCLDMVT